MPRIRETCPGVFVATWIGVVISAQAFQSTPKAHAAAVVIGLLTGIAAWGAFMAKSGLRIAGYGGPEGPAFSDQVIPAFQVIPRERPGKRESMLFVHKIQFPPIPRK